MMGSNGQVNQMKTGHWAHRLEDMVFRHRPLVIAVFAMVSLALAVSAPGLRLMPVLKNTCPAATPSCRFSPSTRASSAAPIAC